MITKSYKIFRKNPDGTLESVRSGGDSWEVAKQMAEYLALSHVGDTYVVAMETLEKLQEVTTSRPIPMWTSIITQAHEDEDMFGILDDNMETD